MAALVVVAGGGVTAPATGTMARSGGDRILLASNRDGKTRGYSMRPDGSRLTPLLPRGRALIPVAASGDGGTIAYGDSDSGAIYVSRANGTRLRRLAREGRQIALSRDGRLLAFVTGEKDAISIVGTNGRGRRRLTSGDDGGADWSPDGKAFVFEHAVGDEARVVVVQPLHGRRRRLAFGDAASWSPDGRWIAYGGRGGLYLVKPNGGDRHRIVRGGVGPSSWSPDGRRLAFTLGPRDVAVVGVDGRRLRRLRLRDLAAPRVAQQFGQQFAPRWSSDGRLLALAAGYPSQVWVVGVDGRRLRRVTSRGVNSVVAWTRLAPALPPARPIGPAERLAGRNALALGVPVAFLAADGKRVAFATESTATDCADVVVWTPGSRSIRRFITRLPAPCELGADYVDGVALAGTRIAWLSTGSTGNDEETHVITATLAHPAPPWVYIDAAANRGSGAGTVAGAPIGDGALVAFTIELHCDPYSVPGEPDQCPPGRNSGALIATTLFRIGGRGPCPFDTRRRPPACTVIAKADGALTLLAVDAGRIVIGTERGVRVLTAGGKILRDFAVTAKAAALSGNRLAVERDGIDVYDTHSGERVARFPDAKGLQDLDRGVLVTASGGTVTLRRLANGRTTTFRVRGAANAQLESPGLFVAGAHRVTFTPMREVIRRLGG